MHDFFTKLRARMDVFLWISRNLFHPPKSRCNLRLNRALSKKPKTKQRRVLKGIGAPRTRVINRCISLSRGPDVESEEEGKGEHIRRSTEEREVAGTITIIAIELPIPLFDGWRSLRRLGYVCLLSQAGKGGGRGVGE